MRALAVGLQLSGLCGLSVAVLVTFGAVCALAFASASALGAGIVLERELS